MNPQQPATESAAPPVAAAKPAPACANCGAPMYGPYCYACGQPEKGMIRHLASVMADVADTIFNVDSRIFRSIPPLYVRPGFLTDEYFAGRRTRYVTPFRLFFFMCVISIFAIQISLHTDTLNLNLIGINDGENIGHAQTAVEVQQQLKAAQDRIAQARVSPSLPASVVKKLDTTEAAVHQQADKRLAWLKSRDEAAARGEKPPADPDAEDDALVFDGKPWDPTTHPVHVGWLPDFVNDQFDEMAHHAKDNLASLRQNPAQAVARMFSVLPQTLFFLIPVFALLLKVVYLFKRRLYMEHLMVALHSHAFICLSLLLLATVHLLDGWADTHAPALMPALRLLRALMWTWLPIYLLLMQKKVYRQGWPMTLLKYGFVGVSYLCILALAIAGAAIFSLTMA